MKIEQIKNDVKHIINKQDLTHDKRTKIIEDLDFLLLKDQELLDLIPKFDDLKRAHEKSIVNYGVDEDWERKMYVTFVEPIRNRKSAYMAEYYDFMFRFHKKICSPDLDSKKMTFFNYQIPLGWDANNQILPTDPYVNDVDVENSQSIDTEFYQIGLLKYWQQFVFEKNFKIDYEDICNLFMNNFGNFYYSDIAVTKSSNGKSRVENSLDQIMRIFRKACIIDKKNRLTMFGVFIINVMDTMPNSELRNSEHYRGIKGQSKILTKPINDLIFNFDLNDFDKLRIAKSSFEKLELQIDKYKSDPKNIEIFNLPNYILNQN
jgi:hypothetical protein